MSFDEALGLEAGSKPLRRNILIGVYLLRKIFETDIISEKQLVSITLKTYCVFFRVEMYEYVCFLLSPKIYSKLYLTSYGGVPNTR